MYLDPFLCLFVDYIWYLRTVNTGHEAKEGNLERPTKPSLINLVQVTQFSGKAHEDAKTHLENFLEITSIIKVDGVKYHTVLSLSILT